MKPARAGERPLPIDTIAARNCDGTSLAVIDDLGRPLVRTRLEKVNSHSAGATDDVGRVDTVPAQVRNRGIGDRILLGQNGDKGNGQAKARERYGNVSFSSPE